MQGIYRGSVVKYILIGSKVACFMVDGDETSVGLDQIVDIPDAEFEKIENELKAARDELASVKGRMQRLDADYHKKKGLLSELYMQARQKEQAVVDKLLKTLR